jgi:hypothetical protein
MTGRDDLDELQALAASISEETQGWRAHRRQRAVAAAQARNEAVLVAPVKRRKKHRWIAASVVSVIVLIGAGLAVVFWPNPSKTPRLHVAPQVKTASYVRIGRRAAAEIVAQGRIANLFSCESIFDTERLGFALHHQSAAWRTGYLTACSNAATANGGNG